jgi:putative MATE family efflux protein
MRMKHIFYDRAKIDWEQLLFDKKKLWLLLIPVIIEQILNSLMGMADTMMVSNVGSAAMSAVSLVDSINMLVLQVFAALATGAAIICSQYLGKGDERGANRAARQIFLTVLVISVSLMALALVFRRPLLSLVFGAVEPEIMQNSLTYFTITVVSYPFIALFNAGAAFYRAGGDSKFPMTVSMISNVMNVVGNALLIFGLGMGVEGAAISTLVSRIFCALTVLLYLSGQGKHPIVLNHYLAIRPDWKLIGVVLAIGIPSGVENGMFQFGKLAIQSTVSTLGTANIAAQAMTIIFENMNGMVGVGIGIGMMTVIGQCIGAGRKEEAKYYLCKLTVYAEISIFLSCWLVMALANPIMHLAGMEPESMAICYEMTLAITIVKPLVWTLSFVPAYGFRAAGDVRFSMIVSTCTMWFCRVALAVFLMRTTSVGPMGVWIGMFADWTIRAFIFSGRYLSGAWLKKRVV